MCRSVCVEVTGSGSPSVWVPGIGFECLAWQQAPSLAYHTHTREGLDRTALGREISGHDRSYGRSLSVDPVFPGEPEDRGSTAMNHQGLDS